MEPRRQGILFVIAAPSGTGKSTVTRRLLARHPELEFSVSYTTRPPRSGERDGEHYHFVDPERFERMRAAGGFLESAEVFGHLYGTPLERTRQILAAGKDLLLDIDVQGARQVQGGPIAGASIMILPPDFGTLRGRLVGRASEDDAERARRLARARDEAASYLEFDYLVVNEELGRTVEEIEAIVRAERRRAHRCAAEAARVLESFPS